MSNINFFNCDCLTFMKSVPDKHYELAIVDPPYGISAVKDIGRRKKWPSYKKNLHEKKDWDEQTPNKIFFDELFRTSKNQIIWGYNYFELPPTKGIIAWDKICDNTDFSDFELAWTSFNRGAKIFRLPIQTESQQRIHPTQKPVALYKWLLKNYAKEGDRIFDSHGGSMSIAIACHDYGFELDICELDKDYFEAGKKRYENHVAQLKMF